MAKRVREASMDRESGRDRERRRDRESRRDRVVGRDRATDRRRGFVREFVTGIGLLGRGFARYRRDPGLLIAGIIPALIAAIVVLGALGVLIYFATDISGAITPFADHWSSGPRDLIRVAAGLSLVGVCGLVAFVTFTSITLAIGDPFYERIAVHVEDELGGVPNAVDVPWWRSLGQSALESIRLVAVSAVVGIPLFVRLADRRRVLRQNRPLAVGFGAAVFVCFLVPLGAIVTMPAAVAGAALLSHRVLGPDGRDAVPTTVDRPF